MDINLEIAQRGVATSILALELHTIHWKGYSSCPPRIGRWSVFAQFSQGNTCGVYANTVAKWGKHRVCEVHRGGAVISRHAMHGPKTLPKILHIYIYINVHISMNFPEQGLFWGMGGIPFLVENSMTIAVTIAVIWCHFGSSFLQLRGWAHVKAVTLYATRVRSDLPQEKQHSGWQVP